MADVESPSSSSAKDDANLGSPDRGSEDVLIGGDSSMSTSLLELCEEIEAAAGGGTSLLTEDPEARDEESASGSVGMPSVAEAENDMSPFIFGYSRMGWKELRQMAKDGYLPEDSQRR